jgi:hypothetical protein
MTYPNCTILTFQYDNTEADKLSRVRTIDWNGTDVCRYSYLGANTFVVTDYLQPQVKLDYALGNGANRYNGFDRFGRVINLPWSNYGSSTQLSHLQYGYDRKRSRVEGILAGIPANQPQRDSVRLFCRQSGNRTLSRCGSSTRERLPSIISRATRMMAVSKLL